MRSLAFAAAGLWGWTALAAFADVIEGQFESHALGRAMAYSLYTPPNYRPGTPVERAYPLVYLLHGVGDNHRAWVKWGQVETTTDGLINAGQLPPLLIVIPDVAVSWLVDSAPAGPGDYATAVARDLVAHMDANYPTVAARRGRAITGHSMGGFGALRLAFAHPEVFAATAAMSAALWSHLTPDSVLTPRQERIFQGSFGHPFDPKRFLAARPRALISGVLAHGEPLGVLLTAGDDDVFRAYRSTFELAMDLREAGIETELRITDGGHTWGLWRTTLGPVLQFLAAHFKGPDSP
ncbi:MAG: alpha/beta hydrolase [Candidatus Competibacterales bacterium]